MKGLADWFRSRATLSVTLLFFVLGVLFLNRALLPPPGQVLAGYDMVGFYYPFFEAASEALRSGSLHVWEPNIFGGYPFLAQPQQDSFYPLAWINLIVPANIGVSWYVLLHIVIAGLGMYGLVRFLGGRRLPATLAGVGFAFGGLLAGRLWAGHITVYAVDAWAPWLLLGLGWSVRRGTLTAAIVAGLPFGLSLLAGHIPSFLYIGLIWGAFALYLFITSAGNRGLVVRQAAVMALVGTGLAAVQLAPFVEYSLTSGRVAEADYQFATDYSLPPGHLMTLLMPEFFGEPLRVGYWSVPTFEEMTYYAGVLAVLGIVLAIRRPNRLSWFFLLLMTVGLLLALGRYGFLYELAYRTLPFFRVVRAPARAAFLYLFGTSALLGLALSTWRDQSLGERRAALGRYWPAAVGVLGVAAFTGLAATAAVFVSVHPTDTSGRLWHQIGGYAVLLGLLVVGGLLVWHYLLGPADSAARGKLPRFLLATALVSLVVFDTWLFAFKMVRLAPAEPDAIWTDAAGLLGEADGRVLPWGLSVFIQNGAMQVGLPSVFGYDSLEPAAHIALASSVPDPRSTAYDVLGASHVVAAGPLDNYGDGERPLTLIGQQGAAWVYERARPLAIARLVSAAEVIPDAAAAIARIHAPDFDPVSTAVVDVPPGCDLPGPDAPAGAASILSHEPALWRIQTRSDTPALLVLAENAYPGWQVSVDGQAAGWLTAYTSIRAVCVPPGEHIVEWRYVPAALYAGAVVTLVTLLVWVWAAWRELAVRRSVAAGRSDAAPPAQA